MPPISSFMSPNREGITLTGKATHDLLREKASAGASSAVTGFKGTPVPDDSNLFTGSNLRFMP